jgi:hypothetical protein
MGGMAKQDMECMTGFEAAPLSVLLKVSHVAAILGVSVKSVHKLVREGKLPCVQVTASKRAFIAMLRRSNTLFGASSTFQNFIQ